MPFTFSHPAIVLPLAFLPKRFFSLTGLIVGSIIPDFEYFLRMKIQSDYSHTFAGIFWFDLPLAVLIAFVFHLIIKNTLIDNLPNFFESRFSRFKKFDWNNYFFRNRLAVIISILIGTFSHLFWDAFTHHGGYFTEIIPKLKNNITISDLHIPILKILQHSSTFLGAIVIFVTIMKMPPDKIENQKINSNYWIFTIITSLLFMTIKTMIVDDYKAGNILVSFISSIFLALIFYPFFYLKKEV